VTYISRLRLDAVLHAWPEPGSVKLGV
jgi:hypothetical protein